MKEWLVYWIVIPIIKNLHDVDFLDRTGLSKNQRSEESVHRVEVHKSKDVVLERQEGRLLMNLPTSPEHCDRDLVLPRM